MDKMYNYTGKRLAITRNKVTKSFTIRGHARLKTVAGQLKVIGLPKRDPKGEKKYIVSDEVAQHVYNTTSRRLCSPNVLKEFNDHIICSGLTF